MSKKFIPFAAAFAAMGAAALFAAAPSVSGAAPEVAVTVKEVEPFPYCAVVHKGPITDMAAVIGQLIGAMQTQSLFPQIRGPMIGVYYNSPAEAMAEELSWEVGFIITAQAAPQPPLVKKTWEHRTVAIALHVGPYDKAGGTIDAIMAWLAAHGYEAAGPLLERYLDMNPAAVKPEDLRTEIWVPCRKK
jgi:effector-binding domain-containing protein